MQLNIIRRITIESKTTGVDESKQKLNQLSAAQDNVGESSKKAGELQGSFERAMLKVQRSMEASNKLNQQMAESFRAMALAQQQSAAAMTAANDNSANSYSRVAAAIRLGAKTAIDYTASTLATAGAIGAGVLAFGTLLGILGPLYLAYKLVKGGVDLVSEAWGLGAQKLAEYVAIAKKAAEVDLSTSYFQKLTKGAEDSKVKIDDLTKALTTLQRQSADQLGGSPLENRLAASVKAGNFSGNTGVQLFDQANTTQQKFEAIVSLINQAIKAGERLAAIDIAGTAFGPEAADNLRKNSEYFDRMVAAAAKVTDKQIVSDADTGRALDLQNRYAAAVAILETRWHPIQDLLTQGGIRMREVWVDIVETVAKAVDWVTKLLGKLGAVPAWFQNTLNAGANLFTAATTTPASRQASEQSLGISSDPKAIADTAAINEAAKAYDNYRGRLQNAAVWQQQMNEVTTIANKVIKDTSHTIDNASKTVTDHKSALTRATDEVERYIKVTNAAADTVGAGVAEQEKARVIALLTAAAIRDGVKDLQKYAKAWDEIGDRAGAAKQKLAINQAELNAKFAGQTLFISPSDLAAANVMKNIYGDEWQKHMDDALAKQIKLNAELADAKSTAQQFTSSFVQGLLQGKTAMQSLTGAAEQLASKLADKAITDLFSQNYLQAGVEAFAAIGAALFSNDQKAKQALKDAQDAWHKMTAEVTAFSEAAAGTSAPLVNALRKRPSNDNEKDKSHDSDEHRKAA